MKINHLLIPYLALLVLIFGSVITGSGIEWYRTLALPAWHPTEAMIGAIWIVIYIGAAWSLTITWNQLPHTKALAWIMTGFAWSTLVNLVWSVVFFHMHLLGPAIWSAIVLGISTLALMALVYPHSKKAALLLLPFALWVFFAAYLNYVVFTLNGG